MSEDALVSRDSSAHLSSMVSLLLDNFFTRSGGLQKDPRLVEALYGVIAAEGGRHCFL